VEFESEVKLMWFDSYRICDSKELIEAKWLCKENALRIDALENKLKNGDPDTLDWKEVSIALFETLERQKDLCQQVWKIKHSETV